jgi:branched-chain amino acid aminotransferase
LKVLWLFGPDHQVTEVGAMNIFFLLRHPTEPNSYELVTPPLHKGDILAGDFFMTVGYYSAYK